MRNKTTDSAETRGDDYSVSRRQTIAAAGAAGAVGLAGCSGGEGGESGGGEGTSGDAADPLSERDEVRVGVLAPVPSENPIGASIANGAQLAVDQINEEGGVGGAELSLTVKDTKEEPQTGRSRYGELIRDKRST
jgi:branched-chain amino acid transport system substrate-binding protein